MPSIASTGALSTCTPLDGVRLRPNAVTSLRAFATNPPLSLEANRAAPSCLNSHAPAIIHTQLARPSCRLHVILFTKLTGTEVVLHCICRTFLTSHGKTEHIKPMLPAHGSGLESALAGRPFRVTHSAPPICRPQVPSCSKLGMINPTNTLAGSKSSCEDITSDPESCSGARPALNHTLLPG